MVFLLVRQPCHPRFLSRPYLTGSRKDRMWSVTSSQRARKVKKEWGAGVADSVEVDVVDFVSCRFLVIATP